MPQTRQLAAIMFTDIVGYTALMGDDESKAFELLKKNRQLQRTLIEQHNGNWIKELGDGVLASFSTVTDAVVCAAAIQKACNETPDLRLRIGIDQSEVVFEDGDVFGDGVNIASRLQAMAPVGGIWISESVYKNVFNKKEIRTRFVREEVLKNVREPVRIYEIETGNAAIPLSQVQPVTAALQPKKTTAARSNRKPLIITSIIILCVAASAFGYWFYSSQNSSRIESIAVLPFVNESRIADIEYLSDGMTETLINSLSKLQDISVKARSSVFHYKGKDIHPIQIGKELAVQAILNGRVAQRGDNISLHLELVDVSTGNQIWGEQYNRKATDIVILQSDIASDVSNKLKARLSGEEQKTVTKNYTQNAQAYQLYLKGRYHFAKRTKDDMQRSIEYFQQAIRLDPNFALAYASIAECYNALPFYPYLTPKEAFPQAKAAAQRALEIDPTLAEGHTALAFYYAVYEWNWAEAEGEFKRAIELEPNSSETHSRYGQLYLSPLGRHDEAIVELKRALELEPLSLVTSANLAREYMYAGQNDRALEQARKTFDLEPNFPAGRYYLGLAYNAAGMYAEAIAVSEKALQTDPTSQWMLRVAGYAYAKQGRQREAEEVVKKFKDIARTQYVMSYYVASIYVALGEKAKAFAELEKALAARDWELHRLKVDPLMDSLRSDPRFAGLLRRIGLER